jgi:hypothetical protein
MMFGASPIAVQRILRHSDIRTTTDVYSHLAPDYLRAEINKLSFRPKKSPDPHPNPLPRTGEGTGFTTPVLRTEKVGGSAVLPPVESANDVSDLLQSGREDSNLRHSAPKIGGRDRNRWQWFATVEHSSRSIDADIQRFAASGSRVEEFCSYFAPEIAGLDRARCGSAIGRGGGGVARRVHCHRVQALRTRATCARPHPERDSGSSRIIGGVRDLCHAPIR